MKHLGSVSALFVLTHVSAFAAIDAYVTFKGQKQGVIKGNKSEKTKVFSFSFGTSLPRNEINSAKEPSGHRKWSPVVVRIETGATTQPLLNAVKAGELLDIALDEQKVSASSSELIIHAHFYDAVITGVRLVKSNAPDAREMEEVTFTFRKIEWTYGNKGKTFSDDWETRN